MINCRGAEASLSQMLDAREARAWAQRALIEKHGLPVISFTLNMPGPVKDGTLQRMAFTDGLAQVEAALLAESIAVAERKTTHAVTGNEALLAVRADALRVKQLLCGIETHCAIGRYFDLDVLDAQGEKISREAVGAPARRCFLCGRPAAECARSRAHGLDALRAHVEDALSAYLDSHCAQMTAERALNAILFELAVTPKPGLVDRANCGAHDDMDFFTFLKSAAAIAPYFHACALSGLQGEGKTDAERFERLQHLGRNAEYAMLQATGGVNTHKGAVYLLGLLCEACGYLCQTRETFEESDICSEAARVCRDSCDAFRGKFGYLAGARAEAYAGFPTVLQVGLPALQEAFEVGKNENDAGISALLRIMAEAEDTNIVRRGGAENAARLRAEIKTRLASGEDEIALAEELDGALIRERLSPGGCADLLAVSHFLMYCK